MARTDDQHVLEAMEDEDFDTLSELVDKVFRACNRELEHHGRAVPTYNFVQAAEKAGYEGQSVRTLLRRTNGVHPVRFSDRDRNGSPVHCWYRGDPNQPPTTRAPRVPRTIRINRRRTEIYPDKSYRLDGRQYRGIELLRMYDAGELA